MCDPSLIHYAVCKIVVHSVLNRITCHDPYGSVTVTIEDAYLATQMIAFWSIYRAAEMIVYIDEIRGKRAIKRLHRSMKSCGRCEPRMAGYCIPPGAANLHPGYVTSPHTHI